MIQNRERARPETALSFMTAGVYEGADVLPAVRACFRQVPGRVFFLTRKSKSKQTGYESNKNQK